ncbi:hypothetical protein [Prescottella agglutinans]|uniref:Uncharacterized protein n=1 Tax=Prescottella agglutinans TaxID=1644129 RepID=A0ABT6ML19_9NOCA|nr:hypothetical protein [Prescottella agglutinans]MDH6284585.1 hypothetical protein [Prescottella agglutinans]
MAVLQPDSRRVGTVNSVAHRVFEFFASPKRVMRMLGWISAVIVAGAIVDANGIRSALVVAAIVAATALTVVAWRRSSSAVLAVVSSIVWSGVIVAAGAATSLTLMVDRGFVYYTAYLAGVWAITVVVLRSRRTGFSPAITAGLGHLTLMATLPIQMWQPSAAAPVAGLLLALAVVWWRMRLTPTSPAPATRWRRNAMRARQVGTGGLAVGLIASTVMLGAAAPASAFGLSSITGAITAPVREAICGMTEPNLEQQPVGAGPESWFSNQNLAKATDNKSGKVSENALDTNLAARGDMSQYTLYEISGLRGLDWVNWQYSPDPEDPVKPDNCSIPAWMWTMSGNAVFTINLYLLQATIALKELAQSKNPVAWLYDKTDSVVANFFVSFAVPLMSLALIVGGVMVGFASFRGGGRDALGKVGASVGVMVVGGLLFGGLALTDKGGPSMDNPSGSGFYTLSSTLDSAIGGINSQLTTAILGSLDGDKGEEFCHVPPGDESTLGQRVSSCVLAETLAYRPWALGQFGPGGRDAVYVDPSVANEPGQAAEGVRYQEVDKPGETLPCYTNLDMCNDLRTYLIVQQGGPTIGDEITKCLDGNSPKDRSQAEQCVPYFAAAKVLADRVNQAKNDTGETTAAAESTASKTQAVDARTMYNAFTGSNGLQRLTQAASSLVATLVIAIALTSLSIITMVWHVTLFGLFMMGPLVVAAATFFGKAHLMRDYLFSILHTFSARAVYGFVMTLIIFIICLVFRSDSIYTGMKIIIVGMVLFGFWKLIRKVDEMIRPKASSINMNVADKTNQNLMRATGGGNLGKAAAGYAGYKGARKLAKAPGAVGRGAMKAAPKVASTGRATVTGAGRAVRGAGVGAVNALGGAHKENVQAARDLGHGTARVTARRLVTAPITGAAGAARGAYQGARGNTPTYSGQGTNRAVDGAARAGSAAARFGREASFQAQYQAMRATDGISRKLNPSKQLAAQQYKQKQDSRNSSD